MVAILAATRPRLVARVGVATVPPVRRVRLWPRRVAAGTLLLLRVASTRATAAWIVGWPAGDLIAATAACAVVVRRRVLLRPGLLTGSASTLTARRAWLRLRLLIPPRPTAVALGVATRSPAAGAIRVATGAVRAGGRKPKPRQIRHQHRRGWARWWGRLDRHERRGWRWLRRDKRHGDRRRRLGRDGGNAGRRRLSCDRRRRHQRECHEQQKSDRPPPAAWAVAGGAIHQDRERIGEAARQPARPDNARERRFKSNAICDNSPSLPATEASAARATSAQIKHRDRTENRVRLPLSRCQADPAAPRPRANPAVPSR